MSNLSDKTLELARTELEHYDLQAQLIIDESLPSFELRAENSGLIIAAPDELELLYGVYDAAEQLGGWDFFEPGQDVFHPELKRQLPESGIIRPARKKRLARCGFIQEYPFDDSARDIFDWMAKNKVNYLMVWMEFYDTLPAELKEFAAIRGISIESGHHNFNYLIPREKYQDHPEFFAVTAANQQRQLAGMPEITRQLCTTNLELRRELTKNLLAYHRSNPEVKYLALNPNDGFGWCECENCSKLYDVSKKGASYCRSENYYQANRIYNQLIEAVRQELHQAAPEVILNFFAYINYASPSPGFLLKPGSSVHLALYWRCINHLIDDPSCAINSGYLRDILLWEKAKAGGYFNIYEYYMGINFYLGMPMIHFESMFHEIEFYSQHHVDGVFTQFSNRHWSAYGANYCFMARAARGEDAETSLERFFLCRFGKYAPQARNFYAELKKMLRNLGDCHIPHPVSLLCRVKMEDLRTLKQLAAELSPHCTLLPGRAFDCWIEYLIRFKMIYDSSLEKLTDAGTVREFLQWIHSKKELKLFVTEKFDHFFKSWLDDIDSGKEWRYFTERDWILEYSRHPHISPDAMP